MKQEIMRKTYSDALDAVVEKLSERKISLDERHLLIVPDIYTFALEKRLFTLGSGSFDLEVTTFNRLHNRINANKPALSKQGAIMLLKKICLEKASELTCFSKSCLRSGFAVKLYDTLTKLRSCSVTPEELRGATKLPKAHDMALLYEEYLKRIEGEFVDAGGRISVLRDYFENTDYLSNCHIYIALYDVFTSEMKKLLSVIEKKALSLTVSTVSLNEGYKVSAPVTVMGGVDRVSQYKLVAKKIKEFVLVKGNRYGEVCVIDESADLSVPRRIFSEYGIPFYADERMKLSETELARFIFTAIDVVNKGYKSEDMLALASNWYSGISKADSDAFASFVRARYIEYKGFLEEFTGEEIERESAESVRKRLVSLINAIVLKGNASTLIGGIKRLLESADAEKRTKELATLDGREIEGIFEKTEELIDLAQRTYGDMSVSIDELISVLKEGFDGTTIALVPNESDTVQIGALAQFRGQRPTFAVIVDFNDGVLPVVTSDDGLITDSDANKLEEYKMKIAPLSTLTNALCREELWSLLKSAKNLFITYSESEESKPSYDLRLLMKVNGVKAYSSLDIEYALKSETDEKKIVNYLGGMAGAIELALTNDGLPFSESLRKAVGEENIPKKEEDKPFPDDAKKIFLQNNATSVSALQTYFDCPFKYFMNYVLAVKKAKEGKIEAVDIGLLLHKIIEKFVENGMPTPVEEFVEKYAPIALKEFEKYSYKCNEEIFEKLKGEAVLLCIIVSYQVKQGSFTPKETEYSFGKADSKIDTIVYPSGVSLMGEIDRFDTYGDYARVIDYKTGKTKFSYNDLYFGRKIQLMIYMQVLRKNGYLPAGVFYFPSIFSWNDDLYAHRLSGPYMAENDMLTVFDKDLYTGWKSTIINASTRRNKDGEVVLYQNSLACTQSELEKMCDYAEAVAGGAIDEIKRGVVTPSPASTDFGSVCDYCDYRAVCGGGAGKERNTTDAKKEHIVGEE